MLNPLTTTAGTTAARTAATRGARSWTLTQQPPAASWLNTATVQPRGQQFGLTGLLVCDGCNRPLLPVVQPDGGRGYRSPCGCRLMPVDAVAIERRVRAAVERHSTELVGELPAEALGSVYAALFVAVRVGGDSDDLSLVWRI